MRGFRSARLHWPRVGAGDLGVLTAGPAAAQVREGEPMQEAPAPAAAADGPPGSRGTGMRPLYVGNFEYDASREQLQPLFEEIGQVSAGSPSSSPTFSPRRGGR